MVSAETSSELAQAIREYMAWQKVEMVATIALEMEGTTVLCKVRKAADLVAYAVGEIAERRL